MKNILLLIILCSCGCTLFKKTSKTKDVATRSSINLTESSRLLLKRADRETQVFTYWNDSSYYQYQQIREHIDQTKSDQQRVIAVHETEESRTIKKATILDGKFWLVLAVLFTICFLCYKRFRR